MTQLAELNKRLNKSIKDCKEYGETSSRIFMMYKFGIDLFLFGIHNYCNM